MKGLSLFFVKNSMGANMKKTFHNSCNGETSTSTLPSNADDHNSTATTTTTNPPRKSVTLEEMILQLDLEEELAQARLHENMVPRRMSCVNKSDIMRSARNALSQYPRFSLDGKDAMYRSSFRKNVNGEEDQGRARCGHRRVRSSSVRGEGVVWCNPGVVARLMGLESIPVPVGRMMMRNLNLNKNQNQNQNLRKRSNYDRLRNDRMMLAGAGRGGGRREAGCASSSSSRVEGRPSFSCQPTNHAFP